MMSALRWSVACATGCLLAACGSAGDAPPPDPAPAVAIIDTATLSADAVQIAGFSLDSVRTVPWQASVTVPGRLMLDPSAMETIGSITEGRISHVLVRVGDRVQAGQVLVMIHSHEIMDARRTLTQATAGLAAAEAERDLAVTAAERAKRLFEAKAMARAEVERAEVARRVAQSQWESAVAEKERAEALVEHLAGVGTVPAGADPHDVLIRTPIAGIVTAREAQPGTVVLPGTPLVVVGNPSRLQLQLHLTEGTVPGIAAGSTVRYTLTEDPTQVGEAVVTRVAPTVDTLTRTIEVLATPRGTVPGRAESFVQAEILGAGGAAAVVVPSGAVQAMEGDTVVFTADQRGDGLFVKAVPVRVGRRAAGRVEVVAGLAGRERVIVRGAAIAKAELLKRRGGGEGE